MKGKITPPILAEAAKQLYPLFDNYTEVGRILNLPHNTVHQIINSTDNYEEIRLEQKKLLIQEGHQKAIELLRAIDPEKAKSLGELAMTYGIVVDKNAVLAGENSKWSNQNISIGDNRKIEISINSEAKSLIKRGQK